MAPRRSISREHWVERRIRRFRQAQARTPEALRVLAEGDSWFTHPSASWKGKSLIGHLDAYRTVNVVSLAAPGDTLARYPDPPNGQWRLACNPDWLGEETFDAVIVSGGGNDILTDDLASIVLDPHDHPGRDGRQLIDRAAFESRLDTIVELIGRVRATVDAHIGAHCPLLMHGYSHARASGEAYQLFGGLLSFGPWIQHELSDRGIAERDAQQDLVDGLVDDFNERLVALAGTLSGFVHVDVRDCLDARDWDDEIHPNARGRRKLARRLRQALIETCR